MKQVEDLREAGAGSDFLELVRPEERSLWRLAITLLVSVPLGAVAAVIAGGVCIVVSAPLMGRSLGDLLAWAQSTQQGVRSLLSYGFELSITGVASIAAALVLLFVASKVQRRAPLTFLTSAPGRLAAKPRLRIGLFLGGLAVGAVLVGAAVVVERAGASQPAAPPILTPGSSWDERAIYAAMAVGFLFLAALAEEIIFRGWFIQVVGAWTRNIFLMLAVNGLVFSFVHFDPNVSGFLVRCLMGAGWAWIALRAGGIEFTTGAHLANNLLISLFLAPVSFTTKVSAEVDLAAVALEGGIIILLVASVEVWLRARPGGAGLGAAAVRLRR